MHCGCISKTGAPRKWLKWIFPMSEHKFETTFNQKLSKLLLKSVLQNCVRIFPENIFPENTKKSICPGLGSRMGSNPQKSLRGGIPVSFSEPLCRSWSHFVGVYRQILTTSLKNWLWDTPTKGPGWGLRRVSKSRIFTKTDILRQNLKPAFTEGRSVCLCWAHS